MKEIVSNLHEEVSSLREQVAELTKLVKQGFAKMTEPSSSSAASGLNMNVPYEAGKRIEGYRPMITPLQREPKLPRTASPAMRMTMLT
jgi:hypothetical protein